MHSYKQKAMKERGLQTVIVMKKICILSNLTFLYIFVFICCQFLNKHETLSF